MDLSGLIWRKSTYSGSSGGACVEVAVALCTSGHSSSPDGNSVEAEMAWGKSSGSDGGRAEVNRPPVDVVAVRDSKDPEGPVLTFSPAAWQSFTSGLKSGDLPTG